MDLSHNAVVLLELTPPDYPMVVVNAALERLLEIPRTELLGQPWSRLFAPALGFENFHRSLARFKPLDAVALYKAHARLPFWCHLQTSLLPPLDGNPTRYVLCTLNNVNQHIDAEATRDFLANHDPVSGLLRPHLLEERINIELLRAVHDCYRLILCYIDIDHFSGINEMHGFDTGDHLIRQIAGVLCSQVEDKSLVTRLGGNKFLLARPDRESDLDQVEIGQQLVEAMHKEMAIGSLQFRLGASIGIACFPDTASSLTELLQQASVASREAKRHGGNQVQVFNPAQRDALNEQVRLGKQLHLAIQRDEMELQYQPIIGTSKRDIVGVEALVRWRHPELGLILPDRFIRLAEEFGMINELGRWVLKQACRQARQWVDHGVGDFTVSVNISGMQLHGYQLLDDCSSALGNAHLPARYLQLELTESAIMRNLEQTIDTLRELSKMGIQLAMDDFGVGVSSLGNLQRMPIQCIKIDRSFVAAVPDDINATRICRAMIGLAHEFGFKVTAEGVERAVQLSFLERNGCDRAQGHYFSIPVNADAVLGMLRNPQLQPREPADSSQTDNILVVDDEQNILRALARLLRRDGYEIFTASTFDGAYDILGKHAIRVIISDQRMPEGKGTDFLKRVKQTHPSTIRMILSGYADIGAVTEAINGGAIYRYLSKPWNDDELRATVREAMRLSHNTLH